MIFQQALVGTSGSNVKLHNLRAILLTLLRHQNISRVRLAELTGLSTTTITNLTAELVAQGMVAEMGTEHPHRRRGVGRPRRALQLVPGAGHALGVHIGVGSLRITLTDLLARPLTMHAIAHELDRSPREVLDAALNSVNAIVAESGIAPETIVGVGVGASGLVDPLNGVNVLAPNLGWRDVPIRQWVAERLPYPVCVDNNVRAMALAEALFGQGQGVAALAFVYARVGVGAGLVLGDQLYHGAGAGAGEIGHTTILNHGDECRCGNRGCLETLVSEPALVAQARALAAKAPDGDLAHALHATPNDRMAAIFAAAAQGDAATRAMLADRARYMGIALANLVNVLNPDLIVMGGLFAQGRAWLLPATEATLRECAFANLGQRARLTTTTFGRDVGAIGAATLALSAFFYQQIDSMAH